MGSPNIVSSLAYEVNLEFIGHRMEPEVTAADLSLMRGAFVWKETLPNGFIGIPGFAFRIPLPHSVQC